MVTRAAAAAAAGLAGARQHAGTCRQFLQGGGGAGAGAERFLKRLRSRFLVCPVCRAGIEKDSGCNHMTCWCGAHFCAMCGQVHPPSPPSCRRRCMVRAQQQMQQLEWLPQCSVAGRDTTSGE